MSEPDSAPATSGTGLTFKKDAQTLAEISAAYRTLVELRRRQDQEQRLAAQQFNEESRRELARLLDVRAYG